VGSQHENAIWYWKQPGSPGVPPHNSINGRIIEKLEGLTQKKCVFYRLQKKCFKTAGYKSGATAIRTFVILKQQPSGVISAQQVILSASFMRYKA
jgi:DsbC/DsbD-like thiol-disulfide interchange protein